MNNPPQIKKEKKRLQLSHTPQKRKWVMFTYFGPYVRTITKLFHNTELNVAFRTTNTINII
jgi:hypothetical protein